MGEGDRPAPGCLDHRPPDGQAGERHRRRAERVGLHSPRVTLAPARSRPQLVLGRSHPSPLVPRKVGFVSEDIHDRGVESLLEERKQLGAHAVPRNTQILIRLVVDERHMSRGEVFPERGAAAVEERPDQRAAPRMHRCQPAGACPSQQAEQKRFGLIVTRVAQGGHVRVEVHARSLEKSVPRASRRILDGPPLPSGEISYVLAIDEQRLLEGRGHVGAEPLIAGRGRPQLMVEMRETDDAKLAGQVERAQQVRERDRVGPAGQRDDHAGIAPRKIMSSDSPPDAVNQLHNLRGRRGWKGRRGRMVQAA